LEIVLLSLARGTIRNSANVLPGTCVKDYIYTFPVWPHKQWPSVENVIEILLQTGIIWPAVSRSSKSLLAYFLEAFTFLLNII
jgi:hypothetical protein